jgi:hypothetical protein
MFEPDALDREVLSKLIFPECFEALAEETMIPENILGDILRQLLHHRYVLAVAAENGTSVLYDVDDLRLYRYRLTHKGLAFIGQPPA